MRMRHVLLVFVGCCFLASTPSLAQTPAAKTQMKPGKVPGGEKFKTVAAAAAHCPGDTVVWSSFSSSHVYHLPASRYYGKTKHGAYMCEKVAVSDGYHASKR
jgi:hypothetical protein